MTLSLRDFFAAHVAAALSGAGESPDAVASRAYDVAEALLRERSFRDAVMGAPADDAPWAEASIAERDFAGQGLLDEPAPMSDPDPSWDDRDFDPRWEAEPHWTAHPSDSAESQGIPSSERPGIRSTRPEAGGATSPGRTDDEASGNAGGVPAKEHRSA